MHDAVKLAINGRELEVPKGQLVIDAAEHHGIHIPRFCYHPRMRPVGMCRMCIVDIDTGRGPALQPSCMIPVADGMVVDTESDTAKKAQDGVLEFLLINHPLDCPVCDKGGECPLQDNAYAYGPGESRFVEEKRHFEKPIPISDLVFLDRERCILCDRCTRFAKEVAGDALIHFINRGSTTEVNTFPDHPFASYFSGNTVQICPVGALTATPFRFKARPWDLEKVESTCTVCSVGCRMSLESSRNHVLRYQGVDVDPVNWGWLCDKGRFSFEAIESPERLTGPMVRAGASLAPTSWARAIAAAGDALRKAEPEAVAVVGGARLTNEAAYAWAKLAKGVIGTDHVDAQLGDGLPAETVLGLPAATIDDVCTGGGTVIVIGADVREELPVLFLRLRHAVEEDRAKIIEISSVDTGLTSLAVASLRCRPGEQHLAVAALLGGDRSAVLAGDLDVARAALGPDAFVTAIVGRPSVGESGAAVIAAAGALLEARPAITFLVALRRGNVRGAIDLGLAPGMLPGRVTLDAGREWFAAAWNSVPEAPGLDATGILTAAAEGKVDVLVLLGADPISDFPDRDLATRAVAGARTVIAVDTFLNPSGRDADVVLAAAGYAEASGTTTNVEGRLSLLSQKVTPAGTARPDWMLAGDLARRLGADLGFEDTADIWAEIERLAPAHAGITGELLRSKPGADGVLVPLRPEVAAAAEGTPVAIQGSQGVLATVSSAEEEQTTAKASGPEKPAPMGWSVPPPYETPAVDAYSLRLVANRKLYDAGTLVSQSPAISRLAPGTRLRVSPTDLERVGVAAGSRVKVRSARTTNTFEVDVDTALPRGVAQLHVNQPSGPNPAELIDAAAPVTDIRIETN